MVRAAEHQSAPVMMMPPVQSHFPLTYIVKSYLAVVIHEKIVFGILKDSSGQNELMLYSSSNE